MNQIVPFSFTLFLANPSPTLANLSKILPHHNSQIQQEIARQYRQIPLATAVKGNLTSSITWSRSTPLEQTNTAIILSEPFNYSNGEIAVPVGSSIIVRVAHWDNSGFVTLEAIAISYEQQGQLQQTVLPPGALIIRALDNQPLTFKTKNQGSDLTSDLAEDALESSLRHLPGGRRVSRNLFRGSRNTNQEFYFLEAGEVSVYVNSLLNIES